MSSNNIEGAEHDVKVKFVMYHTRVVNEGEKETHQRPRSLVVDDQDQQNRPQRG